MIANKAPATLLTHSYEPLHKVGRWMKPPVIQSYGAAHRSLADWAFNPVIGCGIGCPSCNVPYAAMKFLKSNLSLFGVDDPIAQWGEYALVRQWDEDAFLKSLKRADKTDAGELSAGGHRAVLFSSATDPYQLIQSEDAESALKLNDQLRCNVRRALELIHDESTLNVRIMTRSPLARGDFDLYRKFGNRLTFGVSLPTLNQQLSRIYEPGAPPPAERLDALQQAKQAGLHVFVAVSPTYPDSDETDLRSTLTAVRDLKPITIFCEPLKIHSTDRAESFACGDSNREAWWRDQITSETAATSFAIDSLRKVHAIACELGINDRLHLWPDKSLADESVIRPSTKARHVSQVEPLLAESNQRVAQPMNMKLYLPPRMELELLFEAINCIRVGLTDRRGARAFCSRKSLDPLAAKARANLVAHYVHRFSLAQIFGNDTGAQQHGIISITEALDQFVVNYQQERPLFPQPAALPEMLFGSERECDAYYRRARRAQFNVQRVRCPKTPRTALRLLHMPKTATGDEVLEAVLGRLEIIHPESWGYCSAEAHAVANTWRAAFFASFRLLVAETTVDP